jgi:hypothetical protein
MYGARKRTRTSKAVRPLEPESSASASSAIRALNRFGIHRKKPHPNRVARHFNFAHASRLCQRNAPGLPRFQPHLLWRRRDILAPYLCRNRSDSQLPSEVPPPSTASACPFTNPLSCGSAKNAIAFAISSADANLPIGTRPVISASV